MIYVMISCNFFFYNLFQMHNEIILIARMYVYVESEREREREKMYMKRIKKKIKMNLMF